MDYSRQDFTGRNLTEAKDIDGEIVGSCFSQEVPDSDVFPPDAKIRFVNCNLDNCLIPEGCTVEGGSQRRFQVQNDLNDWEIDAGGIPTNVVDCMFFYKNGIIHPNPADIPDEPVEKFIDYRDSARNVRA